MTREELKQAGTKKLISALQYCGRDSYYATYYDEVVDEITQRLNRIEELEKENAELKADNDARKFAMVMSEKVEKQLRQENEKAKEIIKKFSEFVNLEVEYDPEHPQEHTDLWNELLKEAEQFLKEIKND